MRNDSTRTRWLNWKTVSVGGLVALAAGVLCWPAGSNPRTARAADEAMKDAPAQAVEAALGHPIDGYTVLGADMDEAQVRRQVAGAEPGEVFIIPPRASWVLTDTLRVPEGVTLFGSNPGGGKMKPSYTFRKGFDGPLAFIERFVTLHGLTFDGNKDEFAGDGIVAGGRAGVREVRLIRVDSRDNRGHGYVTKAAHYYSHFQLCGFDHNDGYGMVYGSEGAHHTDNVWESVHIGWNGKGGVLFRGVEQSSIWENCEIFHNGGPAFEHVEMPRGKRVGAGALSIRGSVIRNNAGPLWLNRGGWCRGIVFRDCRIKRNLHPRLCDRADDDTTPAELLGLEGPVGLVHVAGGQLRLELDGGNIWGNGGKYLFTTASGTPRGSQMVLGTSGHFVGGFHAPNGFITIHDTSLLEKASEITVASGIGLDPHAGKVVRYGPQTE